MFDRFRRDDAISTSQLNDFFSRFNAKQEPIVIEKKKDYTWLIVLGVVASIVAICFAAYKIFCPCCCDEFDDFDDYEDDYDDLEYDEDYEDEDFDEDIEVEEEKEEE